MLRIKTMTMIYVNGYNQMLQYGEKRIMTLLKLRLCLSKSAFSKIGHTQLYRVLQNPPLPYYFLLMEIDRFSLGEVYRPITKEGVF